MTWNWERPDWPTFTWDRARLEKAEQEFLVGTGIFAGATKHLDSAGREQITIEAITTEAVTTAPASNPPSAASSAWPSTARRWVLLSRASPK
jgi:hypothetical protein